MSLSSGPLPVQSGSGTIPDPVPKNLTIKAHSSINRKEWAKQYRQDKVLWDKAYEFLGRKDLAALKPGKYPIDGENVFATISENPSKEFKVSEWESHRKYQDIHYVITGRQQLGITSPDQLTVREPYDEKRDVIFYNDTGKGKYYTADPGVFFICFPTDAHRPDIRAEGCEKAKKVVIKIRTNFLK